LVTTFPYDHELLRYLEAAMSSYARAAAHALALREAALAAGGGFGRRFSLTSEAFLKWALWRQVHLYTHASHAVQVTHHV
jgi:hypothetical protein